MARSILEIYRKAVFDAGITGKDWRKTEAYDEFTRHYNETYTDVQRQSMKYDARNPQKPYPSEYQGM